MQAYGVDNYLWPTATCGANNPNNCSYSYKNCTDFAMQRIRYTLGLPCLLLGNASSWAAKAAALGYAVNGTPHLGSILALGPGVNGASDDGHVAFVLGVGPGTFFGLSASAGQVVCEQYNWTPCAWSKRVFPVGGGSRFIHFADLSVTTGPPPPHQNPIMQVLDNPLGLALVGGGLLLAGLAFARHRSLQGDVTLRVESVAKGATGHGFARARRRAPDPRAEDRWQDAYQNAAERLFPGRDLSRDRLTWEEDDAVVAEANAEIAGER